PSRQQSTAHVVHIVAIAIVGGAERYDCLQRRRATCSALKSIEATPRNPHHPDRAAAPGLRGQPVDDFEAVALLLLGIFVEQETARFPAAPDVDAHARIAVAGQVGMRERVPFIGAIALAVWQILQDRGNRISLRVVWQPNPGGQRRAVLQRDQRVLDDTYCTWKRRNDQTMASGKNASLPARSCRATPRRRRVVGSLL